jgi:flagellar hook protein FlgE
MGFEQALSGLTAASQNLDTIGNNIANASTIGYKNVRAEFADVYAASLGGATSTQIGIGTAVAAIAPQFTQGNITTTGNPLDIAINGGGFFREVNNGIVSYSRDGEFSLNASGQIVNTAGLQLTGYPADAAGKITSAPPVPLTLSQVPVAPQVTSTSSLSLNLNSGATPIPAATVFSPANSSSYNSSTSMTVYDTQGNAHTATYYFVNTSANNWSVYATGDGAQLAGAGGVAGAPLGTLVFNTSGTLASGANTSMSLSMPVTTGAAAPLAFTTTFPVASTSQYGVPFSVSGNTQDGFATGQLAGFSIGKDGVVSGRYTNGQTRAQGQIALVNFTNPQGLIAQGGNAFAESAASGAPVVGAPGSGSLGSLQSGALESSTVDLTTALVNMITAQRVYQANAETVKTQDQVQQTLMNLR